MSIILRNAVLFIALISFSETSFAEFKKVKFGKVSKEELEMKIYEQDSSATAVILFDSGNSYFKYDNNEQNSSFVCKFERHVRIKILKKEGFNYATFKIPIYHNDDSKEEVESIKARTFNLDGKVIVSKLSKKSIFREESTPNWETVKFTMPNVKVGTIIECKYTIKSPFFQNLRSWQFQYNIPVVRSKYYTKIPRYFKYQKIIKGYFPIIINDEGVRKESFLIKYKKMAERSAKMEEHQYTLSPLSDAYEYYAENIPAFKSESYMLAENNYLSKVDFELQSYQYPNGDLHNYSSTWKDVQYKLMHWDSFGLALKRDGFAKEILAQITEDSQSQLEKTSLIFQAIKNNIRWNKQNRLFCKKSLKKTWKDKTGNSAEINLLLIAMLRNAGITANPVVLSTRQNGIIHPSHPSITQMNYVIACVNIDGNKYVMDATEPYCTIGILPFRCLNGKGRLLTDNHSEWINIEPSKGSKTNLIANLKLTKEGTLKGRVKEVFYDYESIDIRKDISNNIDEYSETIKQNHEDWNLTDINYSNLDHFNKPILISYAVDIENHVNTEDELIYLNPILKYKTTENPFNLEKREYPINFGHSIMTSYLLVLEIPENYIIDGESKASLIKLPGNGGSYSYRIKQTGNKVMISYKFNISKSQFVSTEYSYLKEFYNQIIANEKQFLVFKKVEITAAK